MIGLDTICTAPSVFLRVFLHLLAVLVWWGFGAFEQLRSYTAHVCHQDQLQEVLARTGMEVRYTHGSMAARQYSDEARLQMRRLQHRNQAEGARTACDYETRVNTEIDSYLRDTLDVRSESQGQAKRRYPVQ